MGKTYVDVTPDQVQELLQNIKKQYPDDAFVAAKCFLKSTKSPSKNKPNFTLTFDVCVAPDAIEGDNCLTDIGATIILSIPKKRIKEKYLQKEKTAQ